MTRDILPAIFPWIEHRLDEPLTLDAIARQAGLSPYHFSRLFTARMGCSVMAHVRGRRLARAAHRLVEDPGLALVDLAFDCGFESQEAFTRAFKRMFGVAPGRFRRARATPQTEGDFPMTVPADPATAAVEQRAPVTLDAFAVAGLSRRFDETNKAAIPELWSRLIAALPFDGQVESWNTYGVMWSVDRDDGSFDYMAGVGVKPDAALPAGFARKDIPAATYAVFRITLDGGPLHPQVKAAMAVIWGELIPASGLKIANSPDFELYDGRFSPNRPGAVIDFHVPVEA